MSPTPPPEPPNEPAWEPEAREILMLFTAGWLGGLGLLTVFGHRASLPERLIGAAEAVAAILWFVPRLRIAGFGAMIAVLLVASVHHLLAGHLPGALIFYAAVTVYLAFEENRLNPPRTALEPPDA